jgi:hypothetical protein
VFYGRRGRSVLAVRSMHLQAVMLARAAKLAKGQGKQSAVPGWASTLWPQRGRSAHAERVCGAWAVTLAVLWCMRQVRSKALIQYTAPFISVNMHTMATAFGTDVGCAPPSDSPRASNSPAAWLRAWAWLLSKQAGAERAAARPHAKLHS